MARGFTPVPGVSVDRLPSGAFRVRWRVDGKQRSASRPTQEEAEALAREVGAARMLGQVPVVEVGTTVDAVFTGWLRERKAYGLAPTTLLRYLRTTQRILRAFREVRGLPEGVAVPAGAMTREAVIEVSNRLRTGPNPLAPNTLRATLRCLADAWTWASDDPAGYPGLAPAPRDRKRLVPRGIRYSAPPAPTMAELDAVVRQLAVHAGGGRVGLPTAVVMRSTGLRVGQVLGILVGDVNLDAATLVVRTGKSAREKAERRVMPIPDHLVEYLRDHIADRPPTVALIDVRGARRNPSPTLAAAWTATTAAKLTRPEVWDPPGRIYSRPDHAFRAGYQAHLVTAGVRDEVIDRLVGHANDLRAAHYVDDSSRWEAMREAVALIPPIRWEAEEAQPDNVHQFKR